MTATATGTGTGLVAFGEVLMRLDPPAGDRIVQAGSFDIRYTGAEANVAASVAGLGHPAYVVSTVPDGPLGDAALGFLRRFDVDTSGVRRRAGRLGLLVHESGGAGRPAVVVYDRARSAFAEAEPEAYDWPALLAGRAWLHISGTAPALGPNVRSAVEAALTCARALGLGTSLDLNYRSALWSPREARLALEPLLDRVDLLLGSGPDAATVFDLPAPAVEEADGGEDPGRHAAEAVRLADSLRARFGLRLVAGTARVDGVDGRPAALRGVLVDEAGAHVSGAHPIVDPTGRIGTGDAFAAGLLHGLLAGRSSLECVELAAAAAHLKQSVRGDVNAVTVAEVEAVVAGDPVDRVRR